MATCFFWIHRVRWESLEIIVTYLMIYTTTGIVGREERLDKQSIKLLNITYVQIVAAFFQRSLPDNSHTLAMHSPDKYHTTMPYNESMESVMQRDLGPIQTTGNCNYGTRSLGSAVVRERSIVSRTNK